MPRAKSKNTKNKNASDYIIGAVLFVITGILPLAVKAIERPVPPELAEIVTFTERLDSFAYWRGVILIICAAVILFYFFGDIATGGRKGFNIKEIIKIPPVAASLVYLFFVILSDILSKYPYTALHGTIDRHEGVFIQIAYIVVFLTSLFYARGPKQTGFILAGLIFSSVLMGAAGLSQLLGHDFFTTRLGAVYVAGRAVESITPVFEMAYGMLFNPNTFGLYSSMLTPFFIICGFSYKGKRFVNILCLTAGVLMAAGIFGSRSLGGLMGIAAAITLIAITYTANRVYNKKPPRRQTVIVLAALALFAVLSFIFVKPLNANAKFLLNRIKIETAPETQLEPKDYIFDGVNLSVAYNDNLVYSLSPDNKGWLTVRDRNSNIITETASETPEGLSEEDMYTFYHFDIPEYGGVDILRFPEYLIYDGMYIAVIDNKIMPLMPTGVAVEVTEPIPAFGFKGHETWASMRGYIWSRAIPLLKNSVIIGSGSDTFINEFPQHDITAKKRFYGDPYITVDKAHNLYLQTGVTTGIISMLALLFLFGFYMVTTFSILIKSGASVPAWLFGFRLAVFSAAGAYAVSSMSTDSTIPTASVFWVILGMGYAINKWKAEK